MELIQRLFENVLGEAGVRVYHATKQRNKYP